MRLIVAAFCIGLFYSATAYSQTLFTYGTNAVSKDEFVSAYNKNSNGNAAVGEKAYREYLELYTRFKLKVKAGFDQHLDTLPNQKAELQNFRNQISASFMNDDVAMKQLEDEAFTRSQKDIHLAHIYIPFADPKNPDTAKAWQLAQDAYSQLQKGIAFSTVAENYSGDPAVKVNKGDIGFITVFTLPYELETLAYTTAPENFSKPLRTKIGYHIFKNLGERKAIGYIKAAQILVGIPADATPEQRSAAKYIADSIHAALLSGESFSQLALKYSSDNFTYQTGGVMPDFGVGRFEPVIESAVFALDKDSAISKPILGSDGYHIFKRIARVHVAPDRTNNDFNAFIRLQVQNDPRKEIAKKMLLQRVFKQTGFKKNAVNENQLFAYVDSVLKKKPTPKTSSINNKTLLFSFANQKVMVGDWIKYLQATKTNPAQANTMSYPQLLQQYQEVVGTEYYKNHLEQYNAEFAKQLQEFKEGNLLFEVMQRNIWDKAARDTVGMRKYYEANKNKYWWEPSADVVLFTCSNEAIAKEVKEKVEKNKKGWRTTLTAYEATVQVDSGRYEIAQLPIKESNTFAAGTISDPLVNTTDNSASIVYVIAVHPQRAPRNYEDAKGFVLNDYQLQLEEKWIETLKKKYPVKVNEGVLVSLWK